MFTALRKLTVILLATLQLVAPLVHAHAGEKASGLGLHVPGLEMLDVDHQSPAFEAQNYGFSSEGIIVGIDTGIKDKPAHAVNDFDDSHYLPQQSPVFNSAISRFDVNFSPQAQPIVCALFIPSLSPRAPPAQ